MIRQNQAQNIAREGPCGRATQNPETVLEYCAGTLDAPTAQEFSRHIEACSECRTAVDEQRGLWGLLEGWSPPEAPADFDQRVYAAIAREESSSVWTRWWTQIARPSVPSAFWKPALALTAACLVLMIGLAIRAPHVIDQSLQRRVETIDIEQVESALEDMDMLTPPSQTSANPI